MLIYYSHHVYKACFGKCFFINDLKEIALVIVVNKSDIGSANIIARTPFSIISGRI